uniref:Uncharacterized protein n=1 Tax=Anguilla anguilla TaxID=7936 RepID=A0A0E9X365_ANGAN
MQHNVSSNMRLKCFKRQNNRLYIKTSATTITSTEYNLASTKIYENNIAVVPNPGPGGSQGLLIFILIFNSITRSDPRTMRGEY